MAKNPTPAKSWLNLTIEELEKIVTTGEVPPHLDWNTLPEHPNFPQLFRLRDNPSRLASALLKEKLPPGSKPSRPQRVEYQSSIPVELRTERLKLKREELELQRAKQKTNTMLFDKTCQIETDVKTLKKMMKIVLDFLRDFDARSRKGSQ